MADLTPNSTVARSLHSAIVSIVNNELDKAGITKTIKATVETIKGNGEYVVIFTGGRRTARNINTSSSYNVGDSVWITITEKDAIIIGSAEALGDSYGNANDVLEESDKYNLISPDCINQLDESVKFTVDKEGEYYLYKWDNPKEENKIEVDEQSLSNFLLHSTDVNGVYLTARFSSNFKGEDIYLNGKYGITIVAEFTNARGEIYTRNFVLDSNDFIGNPFLIPQGAVQSKFFEIRNVSQYNKILSVYLTHDGFKLEEGKDRSFSIESINLFVATELSEEDMKDYSITISTPKGQGFFLGAKADDIIILEPVFRFYGIPVTTDDVSYYWFKQDASVTSAKSKSYNAYGGTGWRCLNPFTEANGEIVWSPLRYSDAGYILTLYPKDIIIEEEEYKCVCLYNDNKYTKNFTVFNKISKREIKIIKDGVQNNNFNFEVGANVELTTTVDASGQDVTDQYLYSWGYEDYNNHFVNLNEYYGKPAYSYILKKMQSTFADNGTLVSPVKDWENIPKNENSEDSRVIESDYLKLIDFTLHQNDFHKFVRGLIDPENHLTEEGTGIQNKALLKYIATPENFKDLLNIILDGAEIVTEGNESAKSFISDKKKFIDNAFEVFKKKDYIILDKPVTTLFSSAKNDDEYLPPFSGGDIPRVTGSTGVTNENSDGFLDRHLYLPLGLYYFVYDFCVYNNTSGYMSILEKRIYKDEVEKKMKDLILPYEKVFLKKSNKFSSGAFKNVLKSYANTKMTSEKKRSAEKDLDDLYLSYKKAITKLKTEGIINANTAKIKLSCVKHWHSQATKFIVDVAKNSKFSSYDNVFTNPKDLGTTYDSADKCKDELFEIVRKKRNRACHEAVLKARPRNSIFTTLMFTQQKYYNTTWYMMRTMWEVERGYVTVKRTGSVIEFVVKDKDKSKISEIFKTLKYDFRNEQAAKAVRHFFMSKRYYDFVQDKDIPNPYSYFIQEMKLITNDLVAMGLMEKSDLDYKFKDLKDNASLGRSSMDRLFEYSYKYKNKIQSAHEEVFDVQYAEDRWARNVSVKRRTVEYCQQKAKYFNEHYESGLKFDWPGFNKAFEQLVEYEKNHPDIDNKTKVFNSYCREKNIIYIPDITKDVKQVISKSSSVTEQKNNLNDELNFSKGLYNYLLHHNDYNGTETPKDGHGLSFTLAEFRDTLLELYDVYTNYKYITTDIILYPKMFLAIVLGNDEDSELYLKQKDNMFKGYNEDSYKTHIKKVYESLYNQEKKYMNSILEDYEKTEFFLENPIHGEAANEDIDSLAVYINALNFNIEEEIYDYGLRIIDCDFEEEDDEVLIGKYKDAKKILVEKLEQTANQTDIDLKTQAEIVENENFIEEYEQNHIVSEKGKDIKIVTNYGDYDKAYKEIKIDFTAIALDDIAKQNILSKKFISEDRDGSLTFILPKSEEKKEEEETQVILYDENNKITVCLDGLSSSATFKCTVYTKSGEMLGTKTITLTNNNYIGDKTFLINGGDQVFNYDDKGRSPFSGANSFVAKPVELSLKIIDNTTGEDISDVASISKIIWRIPNADKSFIKSVKGKIGDKECPQINNTIENAATLSINIADDYNANYNDNQISVEVVMGGETICASTNFAFLKAGQSGTNGTEYTLRIYPKNTSEPYNNLVFQEEDNKVSVKFNNIPEATGTIIGQPYNWTMYKNGSVYLSSDSNANNSVDISDKDSATWEILTNLYNRGNEDEDKVLLNVSAGNAFGLNVEKDKLTMDMLINNGKPVLYNNLVKFTYTRNAQEEKAIFGGTVDNTVISTVYPITNIIKSKMMKDNAIEIRGGFRQVQYDSSRTNPQYDNSSPFTIVIKSKNGMDVTSSYSFEWLALGTVENGKNSEDLKLLKAENNTAMYEPAYQYGGLCLNNTASCIIRSVDTICAVVNIPIYFYVDKYGLSNVNGWDGNSIQLNEDGGYILAPQVGAGKKDVENGFTGVLMGEVKEASRSNSDVGLLGYYNGQRSFFVDAESGGAIFGKNSTGAIVIDPSLETSAFIYGGNYFKTDYIKENGFLNTELIKDYTNFDSIKNTEDSGMLIDFTNSRIDYANGNFSVDEEGNMVAQSGVVGGWTLDGSGLYTSLKKGNNDENSAIDYEKEHTVHLRGVGGTEYNYINAQESGVGEKVYSTNGYEVIDIPGTNDDELTNEYSITRKEGKNVAFLDITNEERKITYLQEGGKFYYPISYYCVQSGNTKYNITNYSSIDGDGVVDIPVEGEVEYKYDSNNKEVKSFVYVLNSDTSISSPVLVKNETFYFYNEEDKKMQSIDNTGKALENLSVRGVTISFTGNSDAKDYCYIPVDAIRFSSGNDIEEKNRTVFSIMNTGNLLAQDAQFGNIDECPIRIRTHNSKTKSYISSQVTKDGKNTPSNEGLNLPTTYKGFYLGEDGLRISNASDKIIKITPNSITLKDTEARIDVSGLSLYKHTIKSNNNINIISNNANINFKQGTILRLSITSNRINFQNGHIEQAIINLSTDDSHQNKIYNLNNAILNGETSNSKITLEKKLNEIDKTLESHKGTLDDHEKRITTLEGKFDEKNPYIKQNSIYKDLRSAMSNDGDFKEYIKSIINAAYIKSMV